MDYQIMKSEIEKNCLGKIYKTNDNSYTVIGDVVPHWKDGFCIVVQDNFGKKYKRKVYGNCFITINGKTINFALGEKA